MDLADVDDCDVLEDPLLDYCQVLRLFIFLHLNISNTCLLSEEAFYFPCLVKVV